MISPLRLADLVEASYTAEPTWRAEWPHGRVRAVRTDEDGATIVCFPGTANILDWFVDFRALPATVADYAALGPCHEGFADALDRIAVQMVADVAGKPVVIAGHSLGGALAHLFAGILVSVGAHPVGCWTFGAARCMADINERLPRLLADVPGLSYRHADDPVPFLLAGFSHPRPLTQLEPMRLELDVVADHFMSGYAAALQAG